jgi:hypothetical protein
MPMTLEELKQQMTQQVEQEAIIHSQDMFD